MDFATTPTVEMTAEQLEQELLQLPLELRSRLAEALAESVEREVAALWNAEGKRRYNAYLRGEIDAVPLNEALENLREKLLG